MDKPVDKPGIRTKTLVLPLHVWNSFWKFWATAPMREEPEATTALTPPAAIPMPAWATPIQESDDSLTAQEKYELLSEYGAHILCLVNAEDGVQYLSKNFETITGHKRSALLGKPMADVLHPDFKDRFEGALAGISGRTVLRCKLRHADDKWVWYQLLVRPRNESTDGEFVCVMENIHDTITAQNSLQKAKLEAELALRARSEFLANMSHELRTPLNAVIGFSQIIESEIFGKINNPQYKDYVRHIQDSGYDLLAKIEDLLEIANIDAGRVSLSKEDVPVSDIFRYVTQAQKHHADSAVVNLACEVPEADMLLHVDRLKLQHILGHLVANAIKHCSAGGEVSVVARNQGAGLEISVRDNGAGMLPEKLATILAALQEDNCWASANEHGAVGLGLALTREFVALHGGHVDVDSVVGEGTTVTVCLPKSCLRGLAAPKELEYARAAV